MSKITDGVFLRLVPAKADARIGAKVLTQDGREVNNVSSVSYIHDAGKPPRLLVDIIGDGKHDIVEGEMEAADTVVDHFSSDGEPLG